MKTLGKNQRAALDYVRNHPGCTKGDAADAIASVNGLWSDTAKQRHYQQVDSLIGRGLIRTKKRENGNAYMLYDAAIPDALDIYEQLRNEDNERESSES